MTQLALDELRNPECPYRDFIDDYDNHCSNYGMAPAGYIPLGEDSEDHQFQLATVDGPYISTVTPLPQKIPPLPNFIPGIQKGSGKLFMTRAPEWVGVHLGEVVSAKKLITADDIRRRLGVPAATKVLLLAYGWDALIENIWQRRRYILRELAQLGFDLCTSVNYSIWDVHPHPEKIFNVKRSLIIYQEMQEFGMPTVPHIYWYSDKSRAMWVDWLTANPVVTTVAIDAQTLKVPDWQPFLQELAAFKAMLARPVHFIVTGPETPARIQGLKKVLGSFTLTNSAPCQRAWHRRAINVVDGKPVLSQPTEDVAVLFLNNVSVFNKLMA